MQTRTYHPSVVRGVINGERRGRLVALLDGAVEREKAEARRREEYKEEATEKSWLTPRWACEPIKPIFGPLDCGGFDRRDDAQAFKLGVDRERALHGLLAETVDDIDRERAGLDRGLSVRGRPPLDAHETESMSRNDDSGSQVVEQHRAA